MLCTSAPSHSQETAGTYAETAFFHKKTKTLLLTDAVLKVPQQPPEILASYGFLGSSHPVAGALIWGGSINGGT